MYDGVRTMKSPDETGIFGFISPHKESPNFYILFNQEQSFIETK